jgi:hypothetical protein
MQRLDATVQISGGTSADNSPDPMATDTRLNQLS